MKRIRRRRRLDRRLLILFSIMPFGCLIAILLGLFITWYLFPTRFVNARISDLSPEYAQEVVVMAAADFARHNDVERAKTVLAELNVPNPPQYVALVAEEMIRTNRGPISEDIQNVVNLATALGVSSVSMVAYVSTPTLVPTATPPPTPTPTNTLVVEPANPAEGATELASLENVAIQAEVEEPTPTPTQEPQSTDTPVPSTNTPAPPTNTPEPTATPEPTKPAVDFVIVKERLLTKDENGGCAGNHNIFVDVIDINGNPLRGVQLGDVWNNPGPVTGHKGDHMPGRAEYDLYKDGGYHILVKGDPSAGREVTSEVTGLLSADDWKIGIPKLVGAGYCPDEGTCQVLWNSGQFGVGNNSLCWGHYSWEVVFQRTW